MHITNLMPNFRQYQDFLHRLPVKIAVQSQTYRENYYTQCAGAILNLDQKFRS